MAGGAGQTTVHWVAKNQAQLKQRSTHTAHFAHTTSEQDGPTGPLRDTLKTLIICPAASLAEFSEELAYQPTSLGGRESGKFNSPSVMVFASF